MTIQIHTASVSLFLLFGAGCVEKPVFVDLAEGVSPDGEVTIFGSGCNRLGNRWGSGGSGFDLGEEGKEIKQEIWGHRRYVDVRITHGKKIFAKRTYDEDFLETGKKETIVLEAKDGHIFYFTYFGAKSCEGVFLESGLPPRDGGEPSDTSTTPNHLSLPDGGDEHQPG